MILDSSKLMFKWKPKNIDVENIEYVKLKNKSNSKKQASIKSNSYLMSSQESQSKLNSQFNDTIKESDVTVQISEE